MHHYYCRESFYWRKTLKQSFEKLNLSIPKNNINFDYTHSVSDKTNFKFDT